MSNGRGIDACKIILVALITSLAITGGGFIDNALWDVVMGVVGVIAYLIVGGLFSIGLISSKSTGHQAYIVVFILLLLPVYWIYKLMIKFKLWLLSWPLAIKIIVPIVLNLLIALVIVLIIRKNARNALKERTSDK